MRDTVLGIIFWGMLALCVAAWIYPWRFRSRVARILVHVPLSLGLLYLLYEAVMPVEMNIRIDLFLLYPAFFLTAVCYVIKIGLLIAQSDEKRDPAG